ncbi:MAG: amidohydrolase [Rhodospirillaceae bacterium]|jgi:amidohydrolase|nr:amidohydrolase [Rhodospirillaceae bacterium]MBT5194922.1 amidohydrolase [Rhodospirillaceae bacterium]MBT5896599.1 amidohydrolase [Rhodospirillaceae bacterium]MBT6426112.1 amidohydrolase [Rhodospirillaceae bacterium]
MPTVADIEKMRDEMTAWRRDLHAHPELGFEENRTADFVATKLEEFGLQVHRGIGKTGVVGVLKVGNETTAVGLRADMDALPIRERNSFDHRSTNDGVMHACGHDGHSAMLLAAAKYLAATQNFKGQVNFIFQPAEEGIGGARAMIADGLFEQFPCDTIYAMHNAPGTPIGTFDATAGTRTAAGAFFDIVIHGKGSHGAHPHKGIDPVAIAGELIGALQTVVSRNLPPTAPAVLSITQMHAGDAYNVIPETARLSGTVRTFSMEVMEQIQRRIETLTKGVAEGHEASAEVDFRIIFHPVVNASEPAALAGEVCEELVGSDQVLREAPAGTGSEDFSFMAEQVPGCYLRLGNGVDSITVHNHDYDFNDEALVYGASFFSRIVERSLPLE